MRAILAMAREHGQASPSRWWGSLDCDEQALLLGDWNVRHPAPKKAPRRR